MFVTQNVYNISPVQLSMMSKSWNGFETDEEKQMISSIRSASSDSEALTNWGKLQKYCYEQGVGTVLGHNKRVMSTTNKVSDYELFTFPIYWNAKVAK